MDALKISSFSKRYGDVVAVNNISFAIAPGEFFGFLGSNGAGKTTTISAITGTKRFEEGKITVFGIDVQENYREARKKIGISPQEFNVDMFTTVDKILWYMGGYFGMTKAQRLSRMDELCDIFDLQPHRTKRFMHLSGGLKRRVMLARAMMHDPEILILDEPTAGVDVELRRELWEYLKTLNTAGKTILLTSHYLEEVELLCNRIGIIANGEIVTIADKSEFTKDGSTLEDAYLRITGKAEPEQI